MTGVAGGTSILRSVKKFDAERKPTVLRDGMAKEL